MSASTATGVESTTDTTTRRHLGDDATASQSSNGTTTTLETTSPAPRHHIYRHVAAVHRRTRPSCLSHDSNAAPSFIGFRNLMVIVLVVGNLRLLVENMQKYGVLICFRCHAYSRQDIIIGGLLYFLIPCHLVAAYLLELAAAGQALETRKRMKPGASGPSEKDKEDFHSTWIVIAWIHGINVTLALVITSAVVYFFVHHPLIGTLTEMHAVIVWLKTASYALTNRDLRHAYLHPADDHLIPPLYAERPYPRNITIGNLIYFWWAPTLVYQPVYPRTDKIRWLFLIKRLGECFCLSAFIWFASFQYAAPVLRNSLDKIASLDIASIFERLLKLSTISLVIWLAGFFALFQSFLNALAEMLRFGDRAFYDDWWNSESLGAYWRTWNKPVYTYFKRHVYIPLKARGWSSTMASSVVFLASAVLHEILVGVPTHNIIGVAFLGMLLQLPLIHLTAPLENMKLGKSGKLVGNIIFWAKYGSVSREMEHKEVNV
ncbi:diacylglycerol O-acyltransferase [Ophiocordyceps camponoti-floridani]|uniref:O-acyltransferase n=1 Tax=Ophiocordyceps camponoti-floridani TaxID=2030778 RepID=A0A8H4VAH4_9HYPO|nr:diacylglycerol O-acyltransferase [Ophiocordyceps camponoti-floridani]